MEAARPNRVALAYLTYDILYKETKGKCWIKKIF